MRSSQTIFNDIKANLNSIKSFGGYPDQYDSKLFELFIEAYRGEYMGNNSNPRLTASAIIDRLSEDPSYISLNKKTSYDVDSLFSDKWQRWTEAFNKGFSGGYIIWKK